MPEPGDRQDEELRELAADLGLDPSDSTTWAHTTDAGETQRLVDIDFSTRTVVRYDPVAPESPEVGDYTDVHVQGDSQVEVVVKKRPKCPTCGYILTEEDDPLHLPGRCWQCDTHVCPRCRAECRTCDRLLCPKHTSGVGVEDEALCPDHAHDVRQAIQHERELELRQQDWQEVKLRLDHQRHRQAAAWKHVTQREELALKRQQQRFDNRLAAERLKLEGWKLKMVLEAHDAAQASELLRSTLEPKHAIEIQDQSPTRSPDHSTQ